jgi:hypothetical protein
MAISEDEARRLIAAILEAIPEEAFQPGRVAIAEFISQWRAEVEAGRPVDRKVKVQESPGFDELAGVPRSRTSTTGEFVGKKDYRGVEQLDMLVEALGLSFVAPQMMASRFLDAIERYRETGSDVSPVSVALAPTGEVGDPSLRVDREMVGQAAEATLPLARILEELSQEGGLRERPLTRRQDKI